MLVMAVSLIASFQQYGNVKLLTGDRDLGLSTYIHMCKPIKNPANRIQARATVDTSLQSSIIHDC